MSNHLVGKLKMGFQTRVLEQNLIKEIDEEEKNKKKQLLKARTIELQQLASITTKKLGAGKKKKKGKVSNSRKTSNKNMGRTMPVTANDHIGIRR